MLCIGVQGPVDGTTTSSHVFSETREELEEILNENPEFYERGGSESAAQTGEEYRQTLRKALEQYPDLIKNMPWKVGTGIRKGKERGVFFSAMIDDRPQLCFVRADAEWQPLSGGEAIESELGRCLRLIEVEENTPVDLEISEDMAVPFWDVAVEHFYGEWQLRTDPANLVPKTRKLNKTAIDFIMDNPAENISIDRTRQAIDILASEWSRRDESRLREEFSKEDFVGVEKSRYLIDWIIDTGIPPIEVPEPFTPITREDVHMVCWMAITPAYESTNEPTAEVS